MVCHGEVSFIIALFMHPYILFLSLLRQEGFVTGTSTNVRFGHKIKADRSGLSSWEIK